MGLLQWIGLQPKQFRYTLITGTKEWVLPQAPIGWEESLIKWGRSDIYYGMIRTFTVPLQFVEDGAWILRTQFYTYGQRALTQIRIEELNPANWGYEIQYIGDIDYSTYNDGLNTVDCTIMEGGLSASIKAYENVKYEIDIDVPEAVDIVITPLRLREKAAFIILPDTDPTTQSFPGLTFQDQASEIQSTANSVQSVDFLSAPAPDFATSDHWFYRAAIDTDVIISGNIKGRIVTDPGSPNRNYRINLVNQDGTVLATFVEYTLAGFHDIPFDVDFSHTANLNATDRLFLYYATPTAVPDNSGFYIDQGQMNASYYTISPETPCKVLRPLYVFEQLIKKINGDVAYPCSSALLTAWASITMTSGDAIRQLDNPKIKITFKDFFQSINSVLNAGFAIQNGVATLEAKAYFFQKTLQAAKTSGLQDFSLEPAEAFMYSSIQVGYPDKSYNQVNGRNEVNSIQFWALPITRFQRELNLVSVVRADPYGIEDLRISMTGRDTTDNEADNDPFFIKINENTLKPDVSYTSISGNVEAGVTLYNWEITPKRNLLRHGDFLHSILDKYNGATINFTSALKNADLDVVANGSRVIEKANIFIDILDAPIFLPYIMTVQTKLPRNMMALVNGFPTGYITVPYRDYDYSGFIMDVSVDVSRNTPRELKLLLTPDILLRNLIH